MSGRIKKRNGWDWMERVSEPLIKGGNLGCILFASGLLILRISNSGEGLEIVVGNLVAVFGLYVAGGILIHTLWMFLSLDFKWFRGMAAVYWFHIFLFLLLLCSSFLPAYIRYMILVNAALLGVLWIADYRYLCAVAKELNQSPAGKRLVIDLKEKPKTEEEFFRILEDYCIKNRLVLTYIERVIPAVVELDGVRHKVELSYFYAYGGAVYTMEISTDR